MPKELCHVGAGTGWMAATASIETAGYEVRNGLQGLAIRLCIVFGVLAAASLFIMFAGKMYGRVLVNAGHTTDMQKYTIRIGSDVVAVPANMIRRDEERQDGQASRLDLYIHWPTMSGYSERLSTAFNDIDPRTNSIIFISLAPRATTFDMAGRFDTVYANVLTGPSRNEAGGLQSRKLSEKHGYIGERLFYSERDGLQHERFVARCLEDGGAAGQVLAACTTEINLSETLSAQIRFPARLLQDWHRLDATLPVFVEHLLAGADASG